MGTTPAAARVLTSKRLRPSGAKCGCRSICGVTSAEARVEGGQLGSKRCVAVPTRTSPAGANGSPSERVAAAQTDLRRRSYIRRGPERRSRSRRRAVRFEARRCASHKGAAGHRGKAPACPTNVVRTASACSPLPRTPRAIIKSQNLIIVITQGVANPVEPSHNPVVVGAGGREVPAPALPVQPGERRGRRRSGQDFGRAGRGANACALGAELVGRVVLAAQRARAAVLHFLFNCLPSARRRTAATA